MKNLLVGLSLLMLSNFTFAAIHNGKNINGQTFACRGSYITFYCDGDCHKRSTTDTGPSQCYFNQNTMTVYATCAFCSGTSSIPINVSSNVYGRSSYGNGGSLNHRDWNMNVNFSPLQPNNFNFR